MNLLDWNTLLFAGKWAFIGLIYLALFIVLIAVRREMSQRIRPAQPAPALAPGRLRVLQVGQDPKAQAGAILPLHPETRLGAAADNDLVLKDPYVSGHHARLNWDGANWWLVDLGSRNGTLLNGAPCPPHQPQPLSEGANLQIGDMQFELLPG